MKAYAFGLLAALTAAGLPLFAPAQTAADEEGEEIWVLTPFQVKGRIDGYAAGTAVSGTRLDVALRDLPMAVDVITRAFVEDVAASDLRESLRYTAGILLQSQNDAGSGNSYAHAGGVHNPEGATANRTRTTYKIRGFLTDVTLRNGYRRQAATDAVNIERVEVVYGPSALLYGIGNFGGVVNYLTKQPLHTHRTELGFTVGSHDSHRATLDTTGPLGLPGSTGYRLTAAWDESGDWTEWRWSKSWFISPALQFFPTSSTKVSIDYEHGESDVRGTGFQSLRARVTGNFGAQDQLERAGFLLFDGKDARTFRWSGPDTGTLTDARNLNIHILQRLGEHWDLQLGHNRSWVNFDERDVIGALMQNIGPPELRATVRVRPLDSSRGDGEVPDAEIENVILQYVWTDVFEDTMRDQSRAELSASLDLFEDRGLLRVDNRFLFGISHERSERSEGLDRTAEGSLNFNNPADSSPLRYAWQGGGEPSIPITPVSRIENTATNTGIYAVWQAGFLESRLITVAGLRRDRNDSGITRRDLREQTLTQENPQPKTDETGQFGLTLRVLDGLSIYALRADGLQPNFEGQMDLEGRPIEAVRARSEELGIKFDIRDGWLSGRISAYRIRQSGVPVFYFWAPSPAKGRFDPARPIIYNVANFTPWAAPGGSNGGNGAADAALAEWEAAVGSGAAFQRSANGNLNWYLDASRAEGAAYLDAVFASTARTGGWAGWLFSYDEHTNHASMDWASPEATAFQAFATGDEESSGWEAQIVASPVQGWQLVASYAQTKRRLLNSGKFPRYPYPQDRWAIWYFPESAWGLSGYPLDEAYEDPSDTATWRGLGYGAGESRDDTPLHAASLWSVYRFDSGLLKGLSVGLGGQWESGREYFSGVTDGGGQIVLDPQGRRVVLRTQSRLSMDGMLRYEFTGPAASICSIQLNVFNMLDDQDLYGLLYAPGVSARLGLTVVY